MGGTMAGPRDVRWRMGGHAARWRRPHPLGAGDIVNVPAGIPHSFLVRPQHMTYVLLEIPAKP